MKTHDVLSNYRALFELQLVDTGLGRWPLSLTNLAIANHNCYDSTHGWFDNVVTERIRLRSICDNAATHLSEANMAEGQIGGLTFSRIAE